MIDEIQTPDVSVPDTQPVADTTETAESGSLLGQALEEIPADDTEQVETKEGEEVVEAVEVDFEKDIVLPEGFSLDNEILDEFKPIVKDLKLTKEQTQKLIDLQIKSLQKIETQHKQNFEETKKALETETKNMLGANYQKELAYAVKAINILPEKERAEVRDVLNVSGIGNHPAIVNLLVKVGKTISEDRFVAGDRTEPAVDPISILGASMLKQK